jgi:hypothetical protein
MWLQVLRSNPPAVAPVLMAAASPVAGRGRGRRRDRHPGPVPAPSAGDHPVLPQVVERTRLCPSATAHRHTPQLPRGLPHRDAVRGPPHGPVREQPGRSLSPTDPGASDAPVQICGPRATVSLGARPHPESLSCRPPPPAGRPSSALANTGLRCLARGDVCLKLKMGHRLIGGGACLFNVKLTMPSDLLVGMPPLSPAGRSPASGRV